MATSQNGWPVDFTGARTKTYIVPGTEGPRPVRLRLALDAAPILLTIASRYHAEVEPLNRKVKGHRYVVDDWSRAVRTIRGKTTGYSNHASGSAVDLNATKHPLGKSGTLSAVDEATVHRILHELELDEDIVRWGGDYHGRVDEMHFEVVCSRATARQWAAAMKVTASATPSKARSNAVAAAVGALLATGVPATSALVNGPTPAPATSSTSTSTTSSTSSSTSSGATPTVTVTRRVTVRVTSTPLEHAITKRLRVGSNGQQVKWLQRSLGLKASGHFTAGTRAAVIAIQRAHGLTPDGVVGPSTVGCLYGLVWAG